jgi:hypothetical protein
MDELLLNFQRQLGKFLVELENIPPSWPPTAGEIVFVAAESLEIATDRLQTARRQYDWRRYRVRRKKRQK